MKDTAKMEEELKNCSDFKRFYAENRDLIKDRDLSEALRELIEQIGLSRAEVVRRSELSEVYAYQIISGVRHPERRKLLALLIGMGLDFDRTQRLLKTTGYPELYVKNTFDLVVAFGICKGKSVMEINEMLWDLGEETLG
ncbi:MAG: helix-turn-helix domain-containing protein [Clostridia bacterium]|nr:helix-turn-helix domain-containing protein [Clostridia bacterium]